MESYNLVFEKQKNYLEISDNGVAKRIQLLKHLKTVLIANQKNLYQALKTDLNKSWTESFFSEIEPIIKELNWFIRNLKKHFKQQGMINWFKTFYWTKKKLRVHYGITLMITQSSLPFCKFFIPLIGIIACGNTTFVKLPKATVCCNKLIKKIVHDVFDELLVYFIDENLTDQEFKEILSFPFDLVFFSGTQSFAKVISRSFNYQTTKLVLETNSKCPVIIDETVNLQQIIKEIVWGKCLAAGQTTTSPDYVIIHESVVKNFITLFKSEFENQFGQNKYVNLPKLSSKNRFDKIVTLITKAKTKNKILYGGEIDPKFLSIKPTLVSAEDLKSIYLTSEVKGPLLPVVTYNSFSDIMGIIKHNQNPSAIYLFSKIKKRINYVIKQFESKFFVVNGILMSTDFKVSFGGIKKSGNGNYGLVDSINSFSYQKFIVKIHHFPKKKYANEWDEMKIKKKIN